jgi:hypothetical protein
MASLAGLHAWLYASCLCCSVSRQQNYGREQDWGRWERLSGQACSGEVAAMVEAGGTSRACPGRWSRSTASLQPIEHTARASAGYWRHQLGRGWQLRQRLVRAAWHACCQTRGAAADGGQAPEASWSGIATAGAAHGCWAAWSQKTVQHLEGLLDGGPTEEKTSLEPPP